MPEVGVEAAEFLLDGEEGLRVPDGGGNLEPVAHDAGVGEQLADFASVVARDLPGVEAVEGAAVVVALLEDGGPAQPGLCAFQNEELEEDPVVRSEEHTSEL